MRLRALVVLAVAVALVAPPATATSAVTTNPLQQRFWSYGDSGQGWTGADGTYSVPLPDGRTAWLFSDTFLGTVNEDGSRSTTTPLINNSIVVEDGETFTTFHSFDPLNRPRALVDTLDPVSWFWLGDGTVEQGELRVFLFRFVPAGPLLLFQQVGVWLARFSLPDLTLTSVDPMPQAFVPGAAGGPISFGSGILERDDYTYIYGVEDQRAAKYLSVARVPAGDVTAAWEYWDGSSWTGLPRAARLLNRVANELSVTEHDGGVLLVTSDNAIGANIIGYPAPEPWGPFGDGRVLFTTPETEGNVLTYNAKAHPGRGPPGSLLITYNVNSMVYSDVLYDVSLYRPRFIDVPLP